MIPLPAWPETYLRLPCQFAQVNLNLGLSTTVTHLSILDTRSCGGFGHDLAEPVAILSSRGQAPSRLASSLFCRPASPLMLPKDCVPDFGFLSICG